MIFVFDFTSYAVSQEDIKACKANLNAYCKAWVFQMEACPTTGKHHLQGRFTLKERLRLSTLIKKGWFEGFHLSVTCNENKKNNYYVMKTESRIEGPWADTDPVPIELPPQLEGLIDKLYPYQRYIMNDEKVFDTRHVNVLVSLAGNQGRSSLVNLLSCMQIACRIPPYTDIKDIMSSVMDRPKKKLYFIDIPRILDQGKLSQMFAGIEMLKDGYAYDGRYKFREEYFPSPNIWLFTNHLPDLSCLSIDRWVFWTIDPVSMDLIKWEYNDLLDHISSVGKQSHLKKVIANSGFKPVEEQIKAELVFEDDICQMCDHVFDKCTCNELPEWEK